VSKQACVLGVFKRGLNRWAVGVGMIPRGEVGLIFASIGHTVSVAGTPIFSDQMFAAIVAMVMLTTLVTPPLLKAAFVKSSDKPLQHGVGPGG
jgi:Kef-type K+ transport system membrane component KefB